jgi:hypothetical protein
MRKENSYLIISILQFGFIFVMMLMIISAKDRTQNTFLYDVVSFVIIFIFFIINNINFRERGILTESKLQLQNQNADLFSSSQQLQLMNETLSKEIDEKSMRLIVLDEQIKAFAALALGESEDLRSLEPLVSALQYTALAVRQNAATALWKLGHERGVHAADEARRNGRLQ